MPARTHYFNLADLLDSRMGYSSISSQALSAPPYLFAFICVLVTAYVSDRYRSRSIPIVLHALLACIGYSMAALGGYLGWSSVIRYFALYPAAVGFFSAITIIITWTLNNQPSDSKKGAGMAILNLIGQCGPLVGTRLYPDEDAPYFVRGMVVCAAFMAAVVILALCLRLTLSRENQKSHKDLSKMVGVELREMTGHDDTEPLVEGYTLQERFLYIL